MAAPTKLRDFIRSIRACKTAAEERAVISRESALIRTAFKEGENNFRHRNVAKLLFIHMMGYPTHFAQMECLKLIASSKFSEKRIGYLGLCQLLDENTEVLMLVTNSIKNDMAAKGEYVQSLALCALGNIGSAEMCQSLAREVKGLIISDRSAYVRKKATLCAMRISEKIDDMGHVEMYSDRLGALLDDRDHGIRLAGCCLLKGMIKREPSRMTEFRGHVPALLRSLRSLVASGNMASPAEYDVSGITDPFLQANILRLLRFLSSGENATPESDELNELLTQVVSRSDNVKNTGNALRYECALTALSINAEAGLRTLAINVLSRFLTSREKNLRYVALATFMRVVYVDTDAVDKHRATIIECLKDTDISVKRRALELVSGLMMETNIKALTKELLAQLVEADKSFQDEICGKICSAVAKYSPNRRWQIDTLIKVMCLGGNSMSEEAREAFCQVVEATPELHGYTVIKLFFNMKETIQQDALVQVGVWCMGEFGDHLFKGNAVGPDNKPIRVSPTEVIDLLGSIARKPVNPDKGSSIQALVAAALIKLVTRCASEKDRIKKSLQKFDTSLNVDLQQRSCEFLALLDPSWDASRSGILDRMPVAQERLGRADDRPVGDTAITMAIPTSSSVMTPMPVDTGADLLDLSSEPPKETPAAQNGSQLQTGGGGDLLDLVGTMDTATPTAAVTSSSSPTADLILPDVFADSTPSPSMALAETVHAMDVFDKAGLKVTFACRKAGEPGAMDVTATYANTSSMPITKFVFEVAVPKYMKLKMDPASTQELAPMSASATQAMNVVNTMPGERPGMMKLRISYDHNGSTVQEMAQLSSGFPDYM
jgi:AP-1 complex subunit gamma-1